MIVSCLGSGSGGNCFMVTNSLGEILILDAGVKFSHIVSHKRFTSCHNVVGALITHEHRDHSLAERDLIKAGISVFSYANLEPKKKYRLSNFEFVPFVCPHDGVKNYGFVVKEISENKTFVYATDTTTLPVIKGVDYWFVECNFTKEKWEENLLKSSDISYFRRVLNAHMGLDYLVDFFSKGVKGVCEAIILCHLSDGNADPAAMITAIKPFARHIDIANRGKEWIF